jgi:hypothetical protein
MIGRNAPLVPQRDLKARRFAVNATLVAGYLFAGESTRDLQNAPNTPQSQIESKAVNEAMEVESEAQSQ